MQGIIDKAGAWYSYNKDRIGQGKDNVRNLLKENPDIAQEIELQIREKLLPFEEEGAEQEVQDAVLEEA